LTTDRWLRFTMAMVVAAAGVYILYLLRFVLITLALAAMLAYALLPIVDLVIRFPIAGRPVPRLGAVSLVFALIVLAFITTWHFAAIPISDQAQRLGQNLGLYRDWLNAFLAQARAFLDQGLPTDLRRAVVPALGQSGNLLASALEHVARTTMEWLSHTVEVVLIPILAFYFLVDLPVLKSELLGFVPSATRRPILEAASRLDRILAAYVRGQLILMAISGVVVWLGLSLIGVRLALLLGIVAGVTRAIPIIGPVLGALPIVGVVLVQSMDAAGAVLILFVALQLIETKVILPQVIGHHLQLHAATIIVALLIGNALFGLIGMFLAPPAAAFLRDLLGLFEHPTADPGHCARRSVWPAETDPRPRRG
jgi:predicted PurR-regulated permease PerM